MSFALANVGHKKPVSENAFNARRASLFLERTFLYSYSLSKEKNVLFIEKRYIQIFLSLII